MPTTVSVPSAGPSERLRILVTDDHEVLRAAIRGQLLNLGHAVDEATTGLEAVEAAARERYDLVLLDVQMPEMDGITAARLIRKDSRGHPPWIVGISAETMQPEAFSRAGMDNFLVKPVRLVNMTRVLSSIIHRGETPAEPSTVRASDRNSETEIVPSGLRIA